MSHISEDQLLEYALAIVDNDSERMLIAAHLDLCPDCGARFEILMRETDIIGGVKPNQQLQLLPNPRGRRLFLYAAIKVAALITFGIFVGFGSANWLGQEPAEATYAYLTLTPPSDNHAGCAVSDATELSASYYQEILQKRK